MQSRLLKASSVLGAHSLLGRSTSPRSCPSSDRLAEGPIQNFQTNPLATARSYRLTV